MTETKPDPKSRSGLRPLPLILAGVVVCAGLVLVIAPVMKCEDCFGLGSVTWGELSLGATPPIPEDRVFRCVRCSESGRASMLLRWMEHEPNVFPFRDRDRPMVPEHQLRTLMKTRPSP